MSPSAPFSAFTCDKGHKHESHPGATGILIYRRGEDDGQVELLLNSRPFDIHGRQLSLPATSLLCGTSAAVSAFVMAFEEFGDELSDVDLDEFSACKVENHTTGMSMTVFVIPVTPSIKMALRKRRHSDKAYAWTPLKGIGNVSLFPGLPASHNSLKYMLYEGPYGAGDSKTWSGK
ncbi:hypothetical protein F5Y15DRAFT_424435 [Xylariaceae sp. FL0016]|nr:hypothetical protein F5Y15DRAFT_424435 [Xylariaceae sp. FL0016]